MGKHWVQRYDAHYAHDIIQMKDGEFVKYEAYEQLQAELAESKAENKRLRETINYAIDGIDALSPRWKSEEDKKDVLAIKQTLEQALKEKK